ncbi:carbohydrate kinase family protein [Paenibacillus albus]|uniref:Carbohydrate kinase family protein n=1 Tax=Paenibacillus albus TaxID=2495582 RepID=A0A3Q8XAK3_9BACL|nr:carbohydrate kinase family protein [Paenibacillus albus]AZN43133.1 carbohydrate kinase family protein [Paenibacillus albus]
MQKKFDAVVIGDANIDLIVEGLKQIPQPGQEVHVDNMSMHVGGGAALFSLSLAKLGVKVAFNGILGNDGYGAFIRERFAEHGIDTRMIRTSSKNNTGISIALNPETDRSFITYAGSNAELRMDQMDWDVIAQGRHVHLTGYLLGRRSHDAFVMLAKSLKAKGLTLSCDVGWDDSGEWYDGVFELMRHFDLFLMNETEARHYTRCEHLDDILGHMAKYCNHVVVKLGADGAAVMKDGQLFRRSAYKVTPVDTTGAGDSFNSGYLYGFLTGADVETSMKYGNACGAMSVIAPGGSTGTSDLTGMLTFIQEREPVNS